jgi:hypothetical protein
MKQNAVHTSGLLSTTASYLKIMFILGYFAVFSSGAV